MKVGFIVECGPEGAEIKAIPALAKKIKSDLEIVSPIPLDDKSKLKEQCGKWVQSLIEEGCDKVFIIWDLMPAWGEYEGKGCRHADREEVFASLGRAGISAEDIQNKIKLVCIEKMLEAWLLADERAISAFLSTSAHKISVKRIKKPENVKEPKSALISICKQKGKSYVDRDHACKIVENIKDFSRLNKLSTFKRFKDTF